MKILLLIISFLVSLSALAIPVEFNKEYIRLSIAETEEIVTYINKNKNHLEKIGITRIRVSNNNHLMYLSGYFNKGISLNLNGDSSVSVEDIKKQIQLVIISKSYYMGDLKVFLDNDYLSLSLAEAKRFMEKLDSIIDTLERYNIKAISTDWVDISHDKPSRREVKLDGRGITDAGELFSNLLELVQK
jgi:hypothetical protein